MHPWLQRVALTSDGSPCLFASSSAWAQGLKVVQCLRDSSICLLISLAQGLEVVSIHRDSVNHGASKKNCRQSPPLFFASRVGGQICVPQSPLVPPTPRPRVWCGPGARSLTTPYLSFFERRREQGGGGPGGRAGRTVLMQTSSVTPFAVVMFCNAGDVRVKHAEGTVLVDGWLALRVPAKTAVLLRQLRGELERVLEAAAREPHTWRGDPTNDAVVAAMAEAFLTEASQASPLPPPKKT